LLLCSYEDRPSEAIGLNLLMQSLSRTCTDVTLVVYAPAEMREILVVPRNGRLNVLVKDSASIEETGWSAKPSVLLRTLEDGADEAIWLDADIIVTRDFRSLLQGKSGETLILAHEPKWSLHGPRTSKASAWGLVEARMFSPGINSCFIRVVSQHRPLLERWRTLLRSPEYLNAQKQPFCDRPPHVSGDQDVLEAILCSEEYKEISVAFLRSGIDIAQCHLADGYTAGERLTNCFRGLPPLVHAQGFKPWHDSARRSVHLDCSPYLLSAALYRNTEGLELEWTRAATWMGWLLRAIFWGEPNLSGFIPAVVTQAQRQLRVRTRLRRLLARWSPS
jgi:hypothetical protein